MKVMIETSELKKSIAMKDDAFVSWKQRIFDRAKKEFEVAKEAYNIAKKELEEAKEDFKSKIE